MIPKEEKSQKKIGQLSIKRVPTVTTTILFFILFLIALYLFQGRKSAWARPEFILEIMPDFFSHISNYTLTYLLYTGVAYFWLMLGVAYRYVVIFGVLMILINFIYELFLPLLNTRDIVDAYFGVAGALVGFIFLTYIHFFGLRDAPNSDLKEENN